MAQMARLRLRLIRFGDRDGLETSEATRTRGRLPSVAAGARTDTTWQSREIVGIRNWVLGADEGIGLRQKYRGGSWFGFPQRKWIEQFVPSSSDGFR